MQCIQAQYDNYTTLTDGSDTMENRDKAREIYIKQRDLILEEKTKEKEEAAKDKAWMREKAGLPAQTQTQDLIAFSMH